LEGVNQEPLFVARDGGPGWVRALLFFEAIIFSVAIIALAVDSADTVAWLATLAAFALTTGLILLILPRRFEVWTDRLRLGFPLWRWDIPFDTIDGARPARWWEPYGGIAVRFATSPGKAVVIERLGRRFFRPNFVVSPEDRDEFIARLNAAKSHYRADSDT
jgi:hypothetical protein